MAEDQGKEEEKFDFTPEGEAVGYISLDQARVLAMRHAREEHRLLRRGLRPAGAYLGGTERLRRGRLLPGPGVLQAHKRV